MKKIFAIILILAMLVPFAVACGGENETTTTTTTENTATDGSFSSKDTVKKDWEGETLLIAATTWSGNPSYPWSTMELVIEEGKTSEWGEKIDKAVLERTAYIKATYGVDVVWEWASRYNTHDVLKNAIAAGNEPDYDLAMPRAMRAQAIVANGSVYDIANRPYINFNNSYYNQDSVKTYTAKGHTFFITGDFATLDKETAFILYFNKELLGGEEATEELYQLVRDGKWTLDKLVTYASAAFKDDGDGRLGNNDTYGLYTTSLTKYYEYFGVKQAGVNESTGEWEITLNDPKANDVVAAIIGTNTSKWARTGGGALINSWPESSTNPRYAIKEDMLLFHNEVIQYIPRLLSENVGIVPFPMLNEEQGRYYVPCAAQQSTLMCVPKTTSDRNMSDYFVDVLAWTGREYTMKAYYENIRDQLYSDTDLEMIKDYILPNISYDAGSAVGWGSLISMALSASYSGNKNNFEEAYANYEAEALQKIKDWNKAWGSYTE